MLQRLTMLPTTEQRNAANKTPPMRTTTSAAAAPPGGARASNPRRSTEYIWMKKPDRAVFPRTSCRRIIALRAASLIFRK